jgi:hypothetical protein
MGPCTLKLNEEKSTYAFVAQENGSSPPYLLSLLTLVNSACCGTQRSKAVHLLEKSVINMI